jgi:hypothetical protein
MPLVVPVEFAAVTVVSGQRARRHLQPHNRKKLSDRVIKAAEAALAAWKYVSPIDVLVGIGWLDPGAVKRWRQGQVGYLERAVQTNLPRISEAMKLFRSWAVETKNSRFCELRGWPTEESA